jgi:hypothetical protein
MIGFVFLFLGALVDGKLGLGSCEAPALVADFRPQKFEGRWFVYARDREYWSFDPLYPSVVFEKTDRGFKLTT